MPTIHALYAGGALGYMLYDTCHFYFHHGDRFKNNSYIKWMKKRHMIHHYKDSTKNFGVTSPLFDIIFGTSDDSRISNSLGEINRRISSMLERLLWITSGLNTPKKTSDKNNKTLAASPVAFPR